MASGRIHDWKEKLNDILQVANVIVESVPVKYYPLNADGLLFAPAVKVIPVVSYVHGPVPGPSRAP